MTMPPLRRRPRCYPGPVARKDPAGAERTAHIDEDTLDRYAMNQLHVAELAPVEEHLLVCPHCQDHLAQIDEFLTAFEATLGRVQ